MECYGCGSELRPEWVCFNCNGDFMTLKDDSCKMKENAKVQLKLIDLLHGYYLDHSGAYGKFFIDKERVDKIKRLIQEYKKQSDKIIGSYSTNLIKNPKIKKSDE